MRSRILVTGAAGFIGQSLVEHLRRGGRDVLPVTRGLVAADGATCDDASELLSDVASHRPHGRMSSQTRPRIHSRNSVASTSWDRAARRRRRALRCSTIRFRELDRRARQRLRRARVHGRRSPAAPRALCGVEMGGRAAPARARGRNGDRGRDRASAAGVRAGRQGQLPPAAGAGEQWPAAAVCGARGTAQLRRRAESLRPARGVRRSPGRRRACAAGSGWRGCHVARAARLRSPGGWGDPLACSRCRGRSSSRLHRWRGDATTSRGSSGLARRRERDAAGCWAGSRTCGSSREYGRWPSGTWRGRHRERRRMEHRACDAARLGRSDRMGAAPGAAPAMAGCAQRPQLPRRTHATRRRARHRRGDRLRVRCAVGHGRHSR